MSQNKISFPETALVLLVGPSGSGKSTFAKKHFLPTEVISSDYCRALVNDDENSNEATKDAFDVLRYIAGKRLARGKLTVIDATNVQAEARKPLVELAREYHVLPVAIVLNLPTKVCEARNKERTDRILARRVIQKQSSELKRSLRGLKREGFRFIYKLENEKDIETVELQRTKLWVDKKDVTGNFDIIGDVHGCFDEMYELVEELGYSIAKENGSYFITHPEERKLVFVGDLVDRGPKTPEVLRFAMDVCQNDAAYCVAGNHDAKLYRKLIGKNVLVKHGLEMSVEQLEKEPNEFIEKAKTFLNSLISHYVFDKGRLVVAHAGLTEQLQGRASGRVREFAMYGETTGEIDQYGYPVRYEWALDYRGHAHVVYGHTPVTEAEWLNKTINVDTGCVFGGKLTALRYPEMEVVSVPAKEVYYESLKPLGESATSGRLYDDLLDIKDVIGKRIVNTRLRPNITIREEHSSAALEVMSRWAVNPKWLIYLPPTMSPSETSQKGAYLEYPTEAFDYYLKNGVEQVVCEEKHMGSRAIVIICKSIEVAQKRFGIVEDEFGICYTRTGRRFFNDLSLEEAFLTRIQTAISSLNWWKEFDTDWFCFDTELMPWNLKAQSLLKEQYAAVGSAANVSLDEVLNVLGETQKNGIEVSHLTNRFSVFQKNNEKFINAYREYCWPIISLDDLKLAPFHLMATEQDVFTDKDHTWHMSTLAKLTEVDSTLFVATKNRTIDLNQASAVEDACNWWEEHTTAGGEGFVVKPLQFFRKGKKGLLQPALKTRGGTYLRIIYGANYDMEENLKRLRERGLSKKRSLALREFALGIEALERFVRKEPLYRVHECVFGVLALESDPVDPRL